MKTRWTGPGLLLGIVLLSLPAAAAATGPAPSASLDPGGSGGEPTLQLWLKGPFGTVAGGSLAEPATAPPDDAALDTWMRSATLELAAEVPLDALEDVRVVSHPATDGGAETAHALTDRWFEGPDEPGLHLLSARVQVPGAGPMERAWLLHVPDREGSWETLLQMPALDAELRSTAGAVSGVRGHGCYVGMCQEVGFRPPPETLVPLAVEAGETPRLRLSDGSAVQHWQGQLTPLAGTIAEDRVAEVTFTDQPEADPELTGLEPAMPGEWLLEVRVDYDRDRGWQWFLYRLITPSSSPVAGYPAGP